MTRNIQIRLIKPEINPLERNKKKKKKKDKIAIKYGMETDEKNFFRDLKRIQTERAVYRRWRIEKESDE